MKGIRLFTIFIMLVSLLVGFACTSNNTGTYVSDGIRKFTSEADLRVFLIAKNQQNQSRYGGIWTLFGMNKGAMSTAETADSSLLGGSQNYSTTNIQVEGVDEADIVKTDGTYIYIVTGNEIVIVKAYPPETSQIVSRIKLENTPIEIFINGDRLVVFENMWAYSTYPMERDIAIGGYISGSQVKVKIYDTRDKANPKLVREISADGNYFNSRMIGDYVYVIVNSSFYTYNEKETLTLDLPGIYLNGEKTTIPASKIYYSKNCDYPSSITTILAINVKNDKEAPQYETVMLGYASSVYVSMNNIYITFTEWSAEKEGTSINKFSIDENRIKYEGTGTIPGHLLNQFSMDENNGYFRAATTVGQVWSNTGTTKSTNNVYVLDAQLKVVGKVEDLAPGESIYSVRFMGKKCYMVTFKKVDPLFVIDLSNPENPEVLGQLKITGYSNYLHPYDENHLIGIGKEAEAASQGDFAWYQGVKISLFDVSDFENPKEVAKFEIGDRGTDSPVLYDHKALLFDKTLNLLVLPVTVFEIKAGSPLTASTYGEPVWDGVYVLNISPNGGITLRGQITHYDNGYPGYSVGKSSYYQDYYSYSIKRALYIGNNLYTISEGKIKVNALDDLHLIRSINLK